MTRRGTPVLLKVGLGWSVIGSVSIEIDEFTGARLQRVEMQAMASVVYIPNDDALHIDDEARLRLAPPAGHA